MDADKGAGMTWQRAATRIDEEARALCDRLGVPESGAARDAALRRARVLLLLVVAAWVEAIGE